MPRPELTVISVNKLIEGDTALMFYEQIVRGPDNVQRIFANGSLSFILPEYYGVYKDGIRPTIDGLLAQQTYENGRAGQHPVIYGLLTLQAADDVHGLVAYVHEDDAHHFDDPATAAHNFQANLIHGTNMALETVQSPYRLAELAIHV